MSKQTIVVPDIGTEEAAEVVEVCVAEGDQLEKEQSIIVLETDKASVEVPASHGGKIVSILVKEGDQIKTGAPILEIESESEACEASEQSEDTQGESEQKVNENQKTSAAESNNQTKPKPSLEKELLVKVPDIGESSEVEVIEVLVALGDEVQEGDSLIVLESDKASMEVPAPAAGKIGQLLIKENDKVVQGQEIAQLLIQGSGETAAENESPTPKESTQTTATTPPSQPAASTPSPQSSSNTTYLPPKAGLVYAGPAVRKLARQLGVDLTKVKPTGPRNRCTKADVREYVKAALSGASQGSAIPTVPAIDFSKFGDIEKIKLSKIARATAANMHRSWLNVPHVTQFDDADISDLEEYRRQQKKEGIKLTPVPFILKACALTLIAEPSFNVSLDNDGVHKVQKNYVHIGMAVDTPAGLVVPVLRDVDKKSLTEIAQELNDMAAKARDGKLLPKDMQGGCFTVSSLGAIGGQGFTPIVNTPEVGILGVSKASFKPLWNGKEFEPRFCLPLSLSYDHRAVNGADAGRFLTHLVTLLGDYKALLK